MSLASFEGSSSLRNRPEEEVEESIFKMLEKAKDQTQDHDKLLRYLKSFENKNNKSNDNIDNNDKGKKIEDVLNNSKDEDLRSPLHVAISNRQFGIAELFMLKGADVNAKDEALWSPLHIACSLGDYGTVKLLISLGANSNAQNESGCSSLHYASSKNHLDVCTHSLIG